VLQRSLSREQIGQRAGHRLADALVGQVAE